jgi:hypothetical protein
MRGSRLQRVSNFSSMLSIVLLALILCASPTVFAQADVSSTASARSQQVRQAWIARYNGPNNTINIGNALAVDKQGNVYVVGGPGTWARPAVQMIMPSSSMTLTVSYSGRNGITVRAPDHILPIMGLVP